MFIKYNCNPGQLEVGDCVIRAISTILNKSWFEVHSDLCDLSRTMFDMPSSNRVWYRYLEMNGFSKYRIQNTCPNCMTVENFCNCHPFGRYVLSTCDYISANQSTLVLGSHVIPVISGNYIDWWDSGMDVPLLYFERRSEHNEQLLRAATSVGQS